MVPRTVLRGIIIPLLIAVFSLCGVASATAQTSQPANEKDKQPSVSTKKPAPPAPRISPRARDRARSGGLRGGSSSQPTSTPATYPATQEAQDRLSKFQDLQEVAEENGQHLEASQPASDDPNAEVVNPDETERDRQVREARMEARRRALEQAGRLDAARELARRQHELEDRSEEATTPRESQPPYGSTPITVPPAAGIIKPEPEVGRHMTPVQRAGEDEAVTEDQPAEEETEGDVAPPPSKDGRDYFISFYETPWEDVVQHYAKLIGKPIMGDITVFGDLTYESKRRFTREEMLDELNFLLIEQGSFIVEHEEYIYVVPVSELSKQLELDARYGSREAFETAKLRDYQICEVLIRIKDRPAEEIRDMLSPSMPDRALPVVVGDTNCIKITGLATDVRRFLGLLDTVDAGDYDPRTTKFIKVETNVSQIEAMVRERFDIGQAQRRYNRETRQFEMVGGGDSDIVLIADERTKNLIVRATSHKLEQIEEFIKQIDNAPDLGEFKTTVIEIKYGSATDISRLLNQILQQEQGQTSRAPTRTARNSRNTRGRSNAGNNQQQTQTPNPEDIIVEDIYERAKKTVRIVADERTNNLVVYANDDGLQRVQEILDQIDQPVPSNYKLIELEYADAQQIQPTVEQIARGLSTSSGRGRGGPSIVADSNMNALHVMAEREEMGKIEEIIGELDVEGIEDQWHFVELHKLKPSEAVRYAQPFLSTGGAVQSRSGRRGRSVGASPTAQLIPLDSANTLIVICSDEEWEKVEKVLTLADEKAISDKPEIRFFAVENGSPEAIADTVTQLYGNYTHPVLGRSRSFVDTLGNEIVVQAVAPALEEIESLVKSLDRKIEGKPLVVVPLVHADAADVAEIAQSLLPADSRGRRGRGSDTTASVQPDPVTNSLIIQADQITVDRIKQFVAEREEQVKAQQPERRYYSLKHAAPRDVVTAITQLFSGTASTRRGRVPTGTQVKTVIVGNQIVVDAPAEKQIEVAALIMQLDELSDQGVTTLLVKMPGADVRSIAGRLTNAFREQTRTQGSIARFEADTLTETILMSVSADIQEEAGRLLEEYKDLTSEHVWQIEKYQLKHANAAEAARWLREQLVSLVSQQMSSQVVRQINVTADTRTNRIFINAPELAAKQGLLLLEQYDTPVEQAPEPPMDVWTVELPGLDVNNLASQLQRSLNELTRQRPDRLRANVSADQLTNTLIFSAPSDMKVKIDELVADFSKQTEDMTPVQKFIEIKNADATYIANQVRSILGDLISKKRGRSAAQQVSIQPDTRLNTIVLSAPKFAVEMAESLIAQLDREPIDATQIQTIALNNADANQVVSILRTIFNEKIRAKTMQISVEPLTNSLIVGANKEDFAEIEKWVTDLDESAATMITEPIIIELKNANPWEVNTVLQQTFVQRARGRTVPPGKEIKIAIVAGRSIVAQGPPEKLEEIKELAAKLDEIGQDQMVVRCFEAPGFGTQLNQLARQIQDAVNRKMPGRDQRITVTPLPQADTLIVTATEKYLPDVEAAMEQFKDLYKPLAIETIRLLHGDANMVYNALNGVLREKIRAGKFQLGVEGMTNSLIVSANEEDMAEIRDWVAQFEEAAQEAIVPPQTFELVNANPWEVCNILNATFLQKGNRRGSLQMRFDVMGGRSIVAVAPSNMMPRIEELIKQLDELGANDPEMRTYVMAGMGNRLGEFSRQLQNALNSAQKDRERRVTVTTYEPAEALIVMAQTDQFEQVEKLIDQLKPLIAITKAKTRFYALEYVDANQIVNTVRDLVQKRSMAEGRRGSQDFSVIADPRTNRLIVFAPEAILPEVEEVVTELDIEVEEDDVFTIELKYADPWEVRNMINDVFGYRGSRSGQAQSEQVYVTVSNSTLIVKAPSKKLEQIKTLLAKIDVEDMGGLQIKTYQLKVLNAQTVASQVQMFLRSMGSVSRRGQMQPGAFAEPTTNTLVVIAPPEKLPFIETLITQIEAMGEGDQATTKAYVLKNARADQVQRHVDQMLKAKVAEREGATRGRSVQQKTAVMADTETNRLFVFAPGEYQELAGEMIRMIDEEIDTGEIVHIIPLENGDCNAVAQTINQMMQGTGRGRSAVPQKVKVVPDASSNSILLSGLPKDVAEIESLVKELETASDSIPEIRYFTLEYALPFEVADVVSSMFPSGRSAAEAVSVSEDDYYNRVLITANKRKMRQIEKVIEQLDMPPEESEDAGLLAGGKELHFIEIYRGDAWEIAYDVADFFPPEDRGGPRIESDWFGEYITVICRPGEIDKIEKMIRQFEKRAKPEIVMRAIEFKGDSRKLFEYLDARQLEYNLDRTGPKEEEDKSIIIDLHPEQADDSKKPAKENARAQKREESPQVSQRGASPQLFGGVVLTALFDDVQQEPEADEPPAPRKAETPEPAESSREIQATIDEFLGTRQDGEQPLKRERATVQVMPDGKIMLHGPRDEVEEIEDAIDLFSEDLSRGEVIRIFRFRNGDVNAASRILDMMFNDSSRAAALSRQQQLQAAAQAQQQRGQRGQRGGGEDDKNGQQPGGGLMQQIQQMMGGGGGRSGGSSAASKGVRIATDAAHNYLIVKCDEALLPDIIELLRELDIDPAKVDVRVFQLKNIDAGETAENIKAVLGIGKSTQSSSRRQANRGGNAQEQILEMLQQQMVSVSGGEGSARVEMVEIVSNAITNSLLVSAPPDVMTLIEEVIGKLEGLEGGNITVIKHVRLDNARVEDVLPLLEEIFGSASGAGNRRGGGSGGRGGGSSPADLGSVTVSGDPRNNTIIFVAQAKDVETVVEQIQKLDIVGAIAEVEMYVCKFGDASSIAEAVSAMHQSTSGGGRRGARGGGASSSSADLDIRITAETATNTILVFAPEEKRDEILEQIEKLDLQNRFDVREIAVVYARPENVADTLLQIFGGSGGSSSGGGRSGRSSRRQVSQTEGRIVVVPDENAKKLLVRAPDEVFVQMQDLVAVLDKPSEQLQIRTFALKHADATVVVESVKNAMAEFMQLQQRLGQGDLDMDAFTAIADTRTNSIVVVGSTETFLFVDQVIQAVDGDTPPDQQKQFRTFVLDRSDASTVAEAINAFASGTSASSGGGRRGGGRGSSAMGTGAILDVQAVAEPATNAVMVYGRPEDIDLVEQMVISELEGALSSHLQFATIPVQHAMPTQLIAYIQPFLDETAGLASDSSRGRNNRGSGGSSRQGPRLIGNDNARTIIVYGSKQEISEVETLIARFDNKDTMLHQHEIIPVPWGQDAFALADTVQSVVNESEQENAERTGRQPRLVTIEADEHSNSIIAFGDPAQLAVVKTVVDQLQSIRPEKPVTRVIELVNLSSEEAEQLIGDMQERRSSSGSSSIRRSSPSRSSGSSRRSSGSSSRRAPTRRGRSSNWNPSHNAPRLSLGPAGFGSPVVGTLCCMPTTVLFLQATEGNQPRQPAADAAPKSELPERLQGEIAKLSSISGQLRGDVVATPLDSKRIIVTGDADDVEFIVQMLALMERSTPQPVIQVFELENAKAAAIAPLIEDTLQALIEQRGGGDDRIDSISIIAEARGNTIIASASEPNMEMISEIISKLDLATGLDTKTELIPLKHVRASEAFTLLEDAIKRLNEMREVPSEAQASIQAIERSNAILVVGTKSDISEIQAMIEGIDVELPPEDDFSTAKITIIDLQNAQAEDLAETLTDLIEMEQARSRGGGSNASDMPLLRKLVMSTADGQELPPINLDKPMVIMPEQGKNSLIIFANEANTKGLLAIVDLFDSLPVGAEVEVKSIVLRHAAAEEVADLIEEVFEDAKTALKRPSEGDSGGLEQGVMPPVPPGIAARGLPYNLVVSHDTRTNTVIIVGRKDAVLLAAGLVTELDTPSLDLDLKSYVIKLENLQAVTIQETLEELLDKRLDAIGVSENQARDSAIINVDERSNSLIVLANPELYELIVELVRQLDSSEPHTIIDSEFRRLQYADAAKLAGLLQELFDKKKDADQDVTEGGQQDVLFIFADSRSNALMMTGTRDYLNEANSFVDKLDQAFDPTVQFAVRPVRLNSAANIAQLLRDMIDESRSEQDSDMQGTPIHVAADPYSNNLLLAASAEDMVMLERWIQVLDRPAEPGRVIRIVPLTRGSAQEVADSAQELFGARVSGSDEDVTVTHDETTNSVIAIGPPVVVKDIEEFVNQINQAEGAGAVVRIFKLGQADAADAGELLRSVLEGKAGSVGNGSSSGSSSDELHQVMLYYQRTHPDLGVETLKALRTEIVVIDDLRTNSLIITAPPESIPLMESLVAAVDVPPDSANVRVFRLRNSDAEEMVDMLEELFSSDSSVTTQSGEDTQELQLTFGNSAVGGRQQLSFTVDTRTNAVIAAGTDGYLDLVGELITELDSQPIDDRKVVVYEPGSNDALAIQQAVKEYSDAEQQRLDELQDDISVSRRQEAEIVAIASEDTGRIILGFDPRRESEVMALVHDLDQPPPQVMIQVLIVEVTLDNSLELGVEFAFQDLQYTKAGPTDTNTFDFVGGTDIGAAGSGLGGFTFTITGADFNFLIRTLQNEGNLQVLSRPQIVAMDNQEAYIKVTNDVPYPSGTSVTGTGIVQTNVQRREVGIELTVTPHINPDGYVRLEINQTVSDITSSTVDLGNGLTSPIFLDREAETMVTVKDNETVVLGGLITTSDETREQKIPIIGDVPGLGWLFRNETTDSSRNELLVILTPRVIRSVEDYRELSAQERDRTGYIPPEILSHQLMNQLRVKADQLKVESEDDMLGPFPAEPVESGEVEEDYDEEVYGPVHSSNASRRIQTERHDAVDPDSYEIPMSHAGGSERWAERTHSR